MIELSSANCGYICNNEQVHPTERLFVRSLGVVDQGSEDGPMMKNKSLLMVGTVLGSFLMAASGGAANIGRTDYVTMNRPAALPGIVLPAGSYVFEAVENHPDIVRISDRATKRVLYQGFTDVVARPSGLTRVVLFGEAPRGAALPIEAWFPTGSPTGNAFRHR